MRVNEHIRFEPQDEAPLPLVFGVAFQGAVVTLCFTVIVTTVVGLGAGEDENYLSWALFASLVIGGVCTALQAGRLGRLGGGHILMVGSSGPYIAACVLALTEGGPPTLASLLVVSSVVQFGLATWLPKMRRIVTPVVTGTALMLIAVTVIPIAVARMTGGPGVTPGVALVVGGSAFVVFLALTLRAGGFWRLWAIPIAIATGCVTAAVLGLYDLQPVADAPWFGIPEMGAWPGFDPTPGREFWTILPMFLIVGLANAVKSSSDAAAIQQVSRRRPRAADFRVVQSTLTIGGVGTLLAGIVAVPPPMTYLTASGSLIDSTGVAARRVGSVIGAMLILVTVFPKFLAAILTVPDSVMGAILLVMLGQVFVEGMRMVVQDGLDHRKALMAGSALAIGAGLQSRNVLVDILGEAWGVVLGNGLVAGVLAIVAMTSYMEITGRRRKRFKSQLSLSALPEVDAFLRETASEAGWSDPSVERLRAAGEETLASMLQLRHHYEGDVPPRLVITTRCGPRTMDMEFMAVGGEENIEDRLAFLLEHSDAPDENEISFRLLRHYASSVRHRKYYGIDVVTVQVTPLPDSP